MTKIYSLNGEDYFEDFQDIITDEVEVGGTYWEADKKTYAPSHFFHFGGMLEALREQAFEEAGDFTEDFGKFRSERDRDACEAEIRAVLDKYLTCSFFTDKNPIECTFTKDELTTLCSSCNGSGEGMYEGTRCSTLCSSCNGSGEGMYEGARCSSCGGKGEVT